MLVQASRHCAEASSICPSQRHNWQTAAAMAATCGAARRVEEVAVPHYDSSSTRAAWAAKQQWGGGLTFFSIWSLSLKSRSMASMSASLGVRAMKGRRPNFLCILCMAAAGGGRHADAVWREERATAGQRQRGWSMWRSEEAVQLLMGR